MYKSRHHLNFGSFLFISLTTNHQKMHLTTLLLFLSLNCPSFLIYSSSAYKSDIRNKPNFPLGHPYKPVGIISKPGRRLPNQVNKPQEQDLEEETDDNFEDQEKDEKDAKLVPVLRAHKESSWSTFSWVIAGVVLLVVSIVLICLLLATVWSRQEDEAVAEMVLKRNQSVVNMDDPTASFSALPVRSTRSIIPNRRNASHSSITSLAASPSLSNVWVL